MTPVTVGAVTFTVTVTVTAGLTMLVEEILDVPTVPRLQTRPLDGQLPEVTGLAAMDPRVVFPPNTSVNATPAIGSPVLKIREVKVTVPPTPTGFGLTAGFGAPAGASVLVVSGDGIVNPLVAGPSLLTNASDGPKGLPCKGFLVGKPPGAVSPVT